ncbi:MAG: hypothetical protein ACT4P6_11045 [Gemmatimonadaceae bacterium]
MILVLPTIVVTIAAARETSLFEKPAAGDSASVQAAQAGWSLTAVADRFEARHINETGIGPVPYGAVVLRRTLGSVALDCGAFGRPAVTDNGVSRAWTYVMMRPRSGLCATVTGARFTAVGRKGSAETVTPSVP